MNKLIQIVNPLRLIANLYLLLKRHFKRLLLVLILTPFLFIYLQQVKPFLSLKPLKGYFIPKTYSPISVGTWFSGDYQKQSEDYLNEEFGFRTVLVRIQNELLFLLFSKTNTEKVIIGKKDFMYEIGYIDTYYGGFFMGEATINDTIKAIKNLQDTLKSMGKDLLVVLAPSKARVYPEYIPDYLRKEPTGNTNYNFLVPGLKKAGVNFIDFNAHFLKKKQTSKHLLFPQLGVHWSRLEAAYAYDSIIKKLSEISGKNLPEIKITSLQEKDELEEPDDDIINSMNLLFYPPYKKMAYPEIEVIKNGKDMSNLMVVADSYWWDVFLRELPKKTFDNNEFWYYNKEVWGNSFFGKQKADSLDLKRRILQNDFIILLCTESNYSRIGFGFIGNAITALRKNIFITNDELTDYLQAIEEDPKWMKEIANKAKTRGLSQDSMKILDANWVFQLKGPIRKKITFKDVKTSIVNNKEWMKSIQEVAKEKNISIDSSINENARWYMESVLHITEKKSTINTKDLTIAQIKEIIKFNKEWMSQITTKAVDRGISVDSMMTIDALWYIKQNKK